MNAARRVAAKTAAQKTVSLRRHQGVVLAVNAGPPYTLTVAVGGSSVAADLPCFDFYAAPAVGDVVQIVGEGPDLMVLGVLK